MTGAFEGMVRGAMVAGVPDAIGVGGVLRVTCLLERQVPRHCPRVA